MTDEAPSANEKPAKAPKPAPEASAAPVDTRVAKIRTLVSGVPAKGFKFGPKQVVEGVPIVHAEYLKGLGQVEILEVS